MASKKKNCTAEEMAAILQKEILSVRETALYIGLSLSSVYKLTMQKEIPHYKPTGGRLYFNRKEVDGFMMRNRVATNAELSQKAADYCRKGGAQ